MLSWRQAILASGRLGRKFGQPRQAFRRHGCVKVSSAAEVLEPRYVLTDEVALPEEVGVSEDDPASEPGAFVVEPKQWDDRGLTLRQVGDWLHVFHTGTRTDVIAPMLAAEISSLRLIGRENQSDVLTWDLSFGTTVDLASDWPHIARLHFDGGGGAGRDEIRLVNSANAKNWISNSFGFHPRADRSGLWAIDGFFRGDAVSEEPDSEWRWFCTGLDYEDVELLRDTMVCQLAGSNADAYFQRSVSFGDENNDVLLDWRGRDGLARLTDSETGLNVQLAALPLGTNTEGEPSVAERTGWVISAGNGDDRVIVKKSNSQPWGNPYGSNFWGIGGGWGNDFIDISQSERAMNVFGSDWLGTDAGEQIRDNDTLIGSDYSDDLWGGAGDDLLLGGRGDDWLRIGNGPDPRGNDTLDGGPGCDRLWNDTWHDTELTLTTHRLEGAGTTTLTSIEIGGLLSWSGEDVKFDASGFDGWAVLQGYGDHDTLIGGPYQDDLDGNGGNDWIDERGIESFGWSGTEYDDDADEDAMAETSSDLLVIDVDALESETAADLELIDPWLTQESFVTNEEDALSNEVVVVSQWDDEDASDNALLDEPRSSQESDPLEIADTFTDDLALGELLLAVLESMESESPSL